MGTRVYSRFDGDREGREKGRAVVAGAEDRFLAISSFSALEYNPSLQLKSNYRAFVRARSHQALDKCSQAAGKTVVSL